MQWVNVNNFVAILLLKMCADKNVPMIALRLSVLILTFDLGRAWCYVMSPIRPESKCRPILHSCLFRFASTLRKPCIEHARPLNKGYWLRYGLMHAQWVKEALLKPHGCRWVGRWGAKRNAIDSVFNCSICFYSSLLLFRVVTVSGLELTEPVQDECI